MPWPDDDVFLTQFHGGKDRVSASRMAQRLGDPAGFRTDMRTEADGSVITYQTKGGMPQWRIEEAPDGAVDIGEPRGFAAKVFRVVGATAGALSARLLLYSGKWLTRVTDFIYGTATGYSIVQNTPPAPMSPDVSFFDVVYFSGGALLRHTSTPGGGLHEKLIEEVSGAVFGYPVVISPAAGLFPKNALLDSEDYHIFNVSQSIVNHIAGRFGSVDTTVDRSGYVDGRLPVASTMLAATSGYDASNRRVTIFGVNATFYNSVILNMYHWYLVLQLSSEAPFISAYEEISNPAPIRNYSYYYDLFPGAEVTHLSLDTPGFDPGGAPDTWPVVSVYPYSFTPKYPEDEWHDPIIYIWDGVEGYSGKLHGGLAKTGNHEKITFKNNLSLYAEDIPVGTPIGVKSLRHDATVAVDYQYEAGVTTYDYQVAMPDYPGVNWSGGANPVAPGDPVYGNAGGVTYNKAKNTATTTVRYQLMLDTPVELYSLEANLDYDWLKYDQHVINSLDSSQEDQNIGSVFVSLGRGPLESPPRMTRIRGPGAPVSGADQQADLQEGRSYVTVKCRDYVFHDVKEGIAVYLEGNASGSRLGVKGTYPGRGSISLKVVVVVRSSHFEIPLFTAETDGHNAGTLDHELVTGGFLQPSCIYPHSNPAIYAPVCEQGDFPYIAYTTRAEEESGVAPRFLLSVPLAINKHDLTPLGDANNPPPYSYSFTAYNLSWAQDQAKGSFFSYLYGKAFIIHVSHDGARDWVSDLKIVDALDSEHHFAEVYRV